ncbi:hypothetical protein [Pseudomonas sp.]|uniref:hypothetical protein n=1 Tax=Pseudomonas sp. TaxID=306 RepID=UPI003D0B3DF2
MDALLLVVFECPASLVSLRGVGSLAALRTTNSALTGCRRGDAMGRQLTGPTSSPIAVLKATPGAPQGLPPVGLFHYLDNGKLPLVSSLRKLLSPLRT